MNQNDLEKNIYLSISDSKNKGIAIKKNSPLNSLDFQLGLLEIKTI